MIRILILSVLLSQTLHAGIDRLPLSVPSSNAEWSGQSVDQEMAPGIIIEAMFERAKDETKIVAISAPIKNKNGDQVREFALGIKDSFSENDVHDLRENNTTIAGFPGILMTFALGQGETEKAATLFVFESEGRFFAYMAFGAGSGEPVLHLLERKAA